MVLPALAAVISLGLTGCKDDTQPRLQDPTPGSFVVYAPAMNNYTYYLDPQSTIELVTSQPDYGLGTITQYEVQISLSENFVEEKLDSEGNVVTPANYRKLPTVNTQAKIQISGFELAVAMCSLHGIETDEDIDKWTDPEVSGVQPVYARVAAYVADPTPGNNGYVPGSYILSNTVKINAVQPYFAVNVPAVIYLIGKPQGWSIDKGSMPLSEAENGIGSDIYTAHFEFDSEVIDTGGGGFRFYKELGDWGNDGQYPSIGANPNDGDNMAITLNEETLTAEVAVVAGKGNFQITNWPGGWMKITVNLVNMTATFQPGEEQPAEE